MFFVNMASSLLYHRAFGGGERGKMRARSKKEHKAEVKKRSNKAGVKG